MLTQGRENARSQGPAYRQFSRMRYRELRKQLNHLKESEVVARVIKEWDAMSTEQKNKFRDHNNETMVMLNVEPLSTPNKDKLGKTNLKTTGAKKMDMSEGSEVNLDDVVVGEFDAPSSEKSHKTKKIAKGGQAEYINFFKFHFDKLHREHTRWSVPQISSIVKLLWRKKKLSNIRLHPKKLRAAKPMTGRKFFLKLRKDLGVPSDEGMKSWKRLPFESRNIWSKRGNPTETKTLRTMRSTMKFSNLNESQGSNWNFLNSRMM